MFGLVDKINVWTMFASAKCYVVLSWVVTFDGSLFDPITKALTLDQPLLYICLTDIGWWHPLHVLTRTLLQHTTSVINTVYRFLYYNLFHVFHLTLGHLFHVYCMGNFSFPVFISSCPVMSKEIKVYVSHCIRLLLFHQVCLLVILVQLNLFSVCGICNFIRSKVIIRANVKECEGHFRNDKRQAILVHV